MNPRLVACLLASSLIGWSVAGALFIAGAGVIGAYLLGSLCGSCALVATSLITAAHDDSRLRAVPSRAPAFHA